VDGIVQYDVHERDVSTIDGSNYNDMMDEVLRFRSQKGGEPLVERDVSPKETNSSARRAKNKWWKARMF
jgi:hypothetical protein